MKRIYLLLVAFILATVSFAQTVLIDSTAGGGFELGTDFASNGWTVANGSVTNQWFVGAAATGYSGNMAYVTNNAGATNSYTNSAPGFVHFYRDVTIPAGQTKVVLSFKYKGVGETSAYDLLQISAAPTTVTPSASGTSSGLISGPIVTGATVIGNYFNLSTVTRFTTYVPPSILNTNAPTQLRIIFTWRNDASAGNTPPGSIDDINAMAYAPSSIHSTATGGFWSSPSSWIGGLVPYGLDTAIVVAGSTVSNDLVVSINRVVVDGTLDFSATTGTSITTSGDLIVNASGTFNPFNGTIGRTINLGGNLTLNGNADFSKASTAVVLNGTVPQTISGGGNLGTGSPIRLLSASNTSGITLSRPLTITSTLNVVQGVFNNGTNLTLDNTVGGVTTTTCAIQRGVGSLANPITVGATATMNLAYVFFTGTTNAAVVEGNEVPAGRSINALTMSNALGVTLSNDLTIRAAASALTLTSGIINLPVTKSLIFTSATYTGVAGSATSYINGGVALTWGASGTRTYPTGHNGQLRKAVFGSAIGSGLVRVQVSGSNDGTAGSGVTALSPTRRWSADIVNGAITSYLTVALDYGTDDQFPSANTNRVIGQSATLQGAYYSIGPATTNSTSSVTSTSVAKNELGYFALGLSSGTFPVTFTNATNNGQWGVPGNWSNNAVPTNNEDVFLGRGTNVTLTAGSGNYQAKSLILAGGTLTSNTAVNTLTIGVAGFNNSQLQNDGTLNVSAGSIRVNGSVVMGTAAATVSAFNMSGGLLEIAGNDGASAGGSVPTGVPMLGIGYTAAGTSTGSTGLTLNGTGGTIRIVDHNFNTASTTNALLISISSSNTNTTSLAGTTIEFGNGTSGSPGQSVGFAFNTYVSSRRIRVGNVIANTRTDLNSTRFVQTTSSSLDGSDIEKNLTIHPNSEVRVISGRSELSVGGNIVNNGTLTVTGTLVLGGRTGGGSDAVNNPQAIGGTGIFQNSTTASTASVASLFVDNLSTITLNVPISVSATLTLANGVINTTATNILTHGVVSTLATGTLARTNGYVAGPFKRVVAAAATVATEQRALFAVGNTANYRPAQINFTTAPTTAGTLTAEWINGNSGTNGLPLTEGSISVIKTSADGYWRVSAGDGLTGGVYTGTFTANNITGVTDPSQLVLLKRAEAANSPWTLHGAHVTTTGTNTSPVLSRTGMSDFSEFGIGSGSNNPLPVSITNFSGVRSNNVNTLSWTTVTEQNNKGFELQRSVDGVNYSSIAFVNSKAVNGNSVGQLAYSFADDKAIATNNYYRLNQVDKDGKTTVSNVVLLKASRNANFAVQAIYPVPTTSQLNLLVESAAREKVSISIVDVYGKQVMQQSRTIEAGSNNFSLDVRNLAAGTYILNVIPASTNTPVINKFIKQ
ncbi:MAG: C-terminal target protein [Segetibacter sp.]|nr:C-terminal target protein [Segetibacter sp.]